MKRNVVIIGAVVVIALAIVGYFGWQRVNASAAATAVRAQTTTVTRGTLVATVAAAGNVSAPSSASLAFSSSGRVAKVAVQVGDKVKKDQLLMQLDPTDLQLAVKTAQANLASAQANYDSTQLSVQQAVKTAQSNVASAQANLDSANAKNGTNTDQLIVAKMALDKAKVALATAQGAYDGIAWRSDAAMTTQATNLQNATADYNSALANYNITASGINDTAVRSAQASMDNAKVALDQAQKNIDTSTKQAQSQLDNAKVAVDQAQRNLDKASLYAPFDGYVSAVNFSAGDTASTSAAVSMVDLSNLQVKVQIAEVDMAKIAVGESADMTVDALPGATYQTKVIAVSPVGMVTQGVVNYPVVVAVQNPDGAVKPGMTANLAVQVDKRENVLLVPLRAVRTQGNQKVVTVESKDQQVQVPVTTGLTNDMQVEITKGLQEGDVVVLNQTTTTQRSGGGGGLGVPFMGGHAD